MSFESDDMPLSEDVSEIGSTGASSSSSKQSRKFKHEWRTGQHWLDYKHDQGMFCLLCKKYNKQSFNNDIMEFPTRKDPNFPFPDAVELWASVKNRLPCI